jgi:Family of unknown function (DUF7009)
MKLRIHDNSLRLRLSQPEVARLEQTGRVEDTVAFAPGGVLAYSIEIVPAGAVAATFEGGRIRIVVPSAAARSWTGTDQVALENSGATPRILIEKDFQCLHRPAEPGAFPNPLAEPVRE